MALTKRGKRVRAWAIALALLALWVLADYLTTPEVCRGTDIEALPKWCLELRFPN